MRSAAGEWVAGAAVGEFVVISGYPTTRQSLSSARPHSLLFDGLQELSQQFQHSAFSVGHPFGLSVPPGDWRHNHVRIRFVIRMIWGQDRQQLLRGGMPDVRGPILLRIGLPRRWRVACAVVDVEAIDMYLACDRWVLPRSSRDAIERMRPWLQMCRVDTGDREIRPPVSKSF
jgi:hypothetical protein